MTHNPQSTLIEEVMEALSEHDSEGIARALSIILNATMQIERQQALGAAPYERSEERKGHANGFKDKTLLSRVGKIQLKVPQVRGELEFYPSSIEKGIRSERALKLAIAEMYVNGVSTRRVSEIVEKLCGAEVSSTQVSKAAQLLDEEIEAWRNREIGQIKYLLLDATYESVRMGVSVVSGAVLVAVGVTSEGRRRILGVSSSVSEAEVHWRTFLQSLSKRGLHGVQLISSDDHSGLRAALKSCFPGVPWQRCQFHLQQNAQGYVPKVGMRKEVARDIRTIFRAPNRQEADRYLKIAIEKYGKTAPKLSDWMEKNIPEGLEVFQVPYAYQRFLRTNNMVERQMKEIKRRTRVAMVFPNEKSLLRLVSAILMEVDEQWQQGKRYLPVESE